MNHEAHIEVGRRVYMLLGMGFSGNQEGLVAAMRGEPTGEKPRPGVMQIIRPGQMTFDVITFDGVMHRDCREHDVGRQAIGGLRLLDRVHGPAMIERAYRLVAERDAAEARARAEAPHRLAAAQAAMVMPEQVPIFYWNGIKDAKGAKLQKAWFSAGSYSGCPEGTITIYARDYERFSALVRLCFQVENATDIQSDYFDSDHIRVVPSHPLYAQVKAAQEAQEAHRDARAAKRAGGAQ
jgi:hypothetical protein